MLHHAASQSTLDLGAKSPLINKEAGEGSIKDATKTKKYETSYEDYINGQDSGLIAATRINLITSKSNNTSELQQPR